MPPVNRTPPNLLCTIFKHYLGSGDRVYFTTPCLSVSPESNLAPFILGQVCRYWREVVLAYPSLWSSISINIPKYSYLPLIRVWLDRAKNSPLEIHVEASSQCRSDEHLMIKEVLYMLSDHAHLWRRLRLVLPSWRIPSLLGNVPDLDLPLLEDLSLDILGSAQLSQACTAQIWHKFQVVPQLHRLCWRSIDGDIPGDMPWAQLSYLKIKLRVPADILFGVLRLCENLDELDVDILDPSICLKPLILEKLRRLKITFRTSCKPVYDNLNLPSLTSINICHEWGVERPLDCGSFKDFLTRSSCRLEEFKIWDFKATGNDFISYLNSPSMASVVKLELAGEQNEFVIRSLTSFHGKSPLLPRLKDVDILFDCCREAITALVASRLINGSCATLRTLRINFQTFKLHPTGVRYDYISPV